MWSRMLTLPLVVLIGAGIVDGTVLGGTCLGGRSLSALPVVGGLAALVISALSDQVHAASAAESENGIADLLSDVRKQNTLLASGLVITGLAVLLSTFAPRSGAGFATWAGVAILAMGFVLAIFKSIVGERRIRREPWSDERPGEQVAATHRPT